ncbi:hypothetical protein ABZ424_33120 [Streptomyces sp. NPDC005790]|uniref:hypothetical protein n=1 Tax=Streptomyces sp. NPDC005790 TaxID=3154777 RepID=UPI00340EF6D3
MSDLDNPASLWPAMPSEAQPEPQRWVWAAMDPMDRRQRLRELAAWVDWLRATFELHNSIPPCWYRHPPVVEHLTALYAGWIRTYAGEQVPGRELAEADWINTLHAFTPRLQLAACATGMHQAPPPAPPVRPGGEEELEVFLQTSRSTNAPAWHPAEAELDRRRAEADPAGGRR